jgi:hypothetical protein
VARGQAGKEEPAAAEQSDECQDLAEQARDRVCVQSDFPLARHPRAGTPMGR